MVYLSPYFLSLFPPQKSDECKKGRGYERSIEKGFGSSKSMK